MIICFSYCLYGKYNPKYYIGLEENIKFINKHYPNYLIHIWFGSDVELDKINMNLLNTSNLIIKHLNVTGYIVHAYRFLSIDEPNIDIVFSRDCDSRISDREIKLNNRFINSKYLLHTIRDHKGQHMPLMAGLFGIKKEIKKYFKNEEIKNQFMYLFEILKNNPEYITYTTDQNLLITLFYTNFKNYLLVHSTKNIFSDPNFIKINPPEDNNFCGQVIDYDGSGNSFMVYEYKNYED
jgi:hypothetical protein